MSVSGTVGYQHAGQAHAEPYAHRSVPYGGQPYPVQPYGPPYAVQPYLAPPHPWGHPRTSGSAITVLVLGIVSLALLFGCIGFIPAIIALCLAPGAKREIGQAGGTLTGHALVQAGQALSWVTIAATLAAMLMGLVPVMLALAVAVGL